MNRGAAVFQILDMSEYSPMFLIRIELKEFSKNFQMPTEHLAFKCITHFKLSFLFMNNSKLNSAI